MRMGDPASPALVTGRDRLDYAGLADRIHRAALRLRALGLREGDPIAILARNCAEWVVLAHAIPRIGAVLVPLNVRLSEREILRQCERSRIRLLVHEGDLPAIAWSGPTIPLGEFEQVPVADLVAALERLPLAGSLAPGEPKEVALAEPKADRPCAIVFTSGSGAEPKGAVLTWGNEVASARAVVEAIGLRPEDRWLLCLPLFHVGGLNILYRCALAGACVVLEDRFDPERINASIDAERVTVISLVPTMLQDLLEQREGRPFPGALRAIVAGGAPVPQDLIDRCPQALATYGMTETCSMVTLVRPFASGQDERRSAGRPLPGIEIRVTNKRSRSLPAGATGTIEVRGRVVMRGYLGEPPLDLEDGWFRTDDLGVLDGAGNLRVVGRASETIISGGENVHPAEIEAVLLAHPRVAEAAVIGVPDERWGARPLAAVVPRGGGFDAVELQGFLKERLAGYKVPQIEVVDEIPRLPNGKPNRLMIVNRFRGRV